MIGYPEAYLDIETTGLYPHESAITVIGIYFCNGDDGRLVQLYDSTVSCDNLLEAMRGTEHMYTYNGSRFDIPFIRACLGPDLDRLHRHTDLMYKCWDYNLRGGFKRVLQHLGIFRETEGLNGMDAIRLWERYKQFNDPDALDLLLRYNRDDIVNLRQLRDALAEFDAPCEA
ncbi:MAG: ribonuclease H-like domain-containing protein [Dehalococcoidia bacterium]